MWRCEPAIFLGKIVRGGGIAPFAPPPAKKKEEPANLNMLLPSQHIRTPFFLLIFLFQVDFPCLVFVRTHDEFVVNSVGGYAYTYISVLSMSLALDKWETVAI